jgi:hypothetical protein
MANTLTNLIPDAYAALDVVSRELVGFIPAVARDPRADRVAVGQTLRIPVSPSNTSAADITAAMSLPSVSDQTFTNKTLTISKSRYTRFNWSGTEQRAMDAGVGSLTMQQDQIANALRALVNEVEVDLGAAIADGASRAYGTAGTTPFATAGDFSDIAYAAKILDDNGAPKTDRHVVLGTTASAQLRAKQSSLFKVNEAGTDDLLRRGYIGDIMGYRIHESAQVDNTTAGTGASYLLNGALAVGDTTVTVDTGSGTILAGDIVTIGSHKYVVATALSGGIFTVNAPGIRAVAADNLAISVNATSVRNIALARNSTLLATRLPDIGSDGDQASAREIITDPVSGLSFELAVYPGFRMNVYFIGLSWGVSVIKSEHAAIILG